MSSWREVCTNVKMKTCTKKIIIIQKVHLTHTKKFCCIKMQQKKCTPLSINTPNMMENKKKSYKIKMK